MHCSKLEKGHKLCKTQLCQRLPQSRGFEGLLDQASQYPETQTDKQTDAPQVQALCVCSGMVYSGQVERKTKTYETFSYTQLVRMELLTSDANIVCFWHPANDEMNPQSLEEEFSQNENPQSSFTPHQIVETHILQNACGEFFLFRRSKFGLGLSSPQNGTILQVS